MIAGIKQVCKMLESGGLEYIVLAADADEHIKNKVHAAANGVEIRSFPSKAELGAQLGLDVACAVAGQPKL